MSWAWLAKLPNTQAQIAAAIVLAFATGARVVAVGWNPPSEWLWFIIALGGIGTVSYVGKRLTDNDYVATKQGNLPPPPTPKAPTT